MSVIVRSSENLIVLRLSHTVTPADLADAAEVLDRIDRTTPGLMRFVDATAVTGTELNFVTVARFAQDRRRWSMARNVRTAILATSNFVFGFARMYQDLLQHPQITVEVFRDRAAALAWLGVEEEPSVPAESDPSSPARRTGSPDPILSLAVS